MTVEPPKCRTCGVAEWRHTCAGMPPAPLIEKPNKERKPKKKRDRRAYNRQYWRDNRSPKVKKGKPINGQRGKLDDSPAGGTRGAS